MKQAFGTLGGRWKALDLGTRILLLAAALGLAVGGYFVYQRSNTVDWAVLYANVDDATASKVLAGLDAHGVKYRLEGNGTRILVPRSQVATSRVALAGDGINATPVPEGFDEIFSGQGLATSDFEQRVNYERALEGELARTLLTMQPVAGARVQLTIPEQSIFVGSGSDPAQKPTASVVLSLRRDLTRAESDTIANVVASSVEGLTADQVTIASSDGTMLRAPGGDTTGAAGTANLDATTEYESNLSARLTDLARTLTGQANAAVEVRAVLDFTQSTVEKEVIDPTKNTPTAEHESSETWTGSGGSAGGTAGVDGGPVDATGGTNGTYEKTDKTTTYTPGDRTITRSTVSAPTVTRLTVAVVVPVASDAGGQPTTEVDEQTLARVLGSAAGLDESRGDAIEVAVVPANAADGGQLITDPSATGTSATATTTASPPIPTVAAAGAGAFVMLLIALAFRRRKGKHDDVAVGGRGRRRKGKGAAEGPESTELLPPVRPGSPLDPEREAVEEIRGDLERMVNESPESLAALLSNWMAK